MNPGSDKREVRSFVRRSGRLTPGQVRALAELWPKYGLDAENGRIDAEAVFGRKAPCVLEIGFGNGESLVEQATTDPGADFIGVEVHRPGIGHCLMHLASAGVDNVRLVEADAVDVLERRLDDRTLDRINLYFPDPWPKKRHHKRRILNAAFLALCARRLKRGAHLHIATDWTDYAEHIDLELTRSPNFRIVERREHDGSRPLERPPTKFEKRGLKLGHPIVDWKLAAN